LTDHQDQSQKKPNFFQRQKGMLMLLGILAVAAFFCGSVPFYSLPWIQTQVLGIPKAARPVIQLPPENLTAAPLFNFFGSPVYLTNTLVAVLLTDILLIILALIARRGLKEIPGGFSHIMEMLVEFLYNLSEQIVGARWAPKIFPIAGTIFIFLLAANWMHFIPGVDSVGILHHAEAGARGFEAAEVANSGVYYLKVDDPGGIPVPTAPVPTASEESGEETQHEEQEDGGLYIVTPFVRTAATDINVPLGLAVVAFVTIQVFGVIGLGWGYLAKFVNTPGLARGGMGFMDFGVGLFEMVLEPVKIISLTFRLLGNIFGGGILVAVVSTLIAFMVPAGLYLLELFIGALQAYIFAVLTLVFTNVAMAGHGGEH
jgi:F-type H+-transporting ATPase subunit a